VARLFFLLSGEHETLPAAELKAVLEAENHKFKTLQKLDQILRIEADVDSIKAIKRRAAFTRVCGFELFNCKAETPTIRKAMGSTSLEEVLENGETFAVRIKRVKEHSLNVETVLLERQLGELMLHQTRGTRVDLKSPGKTFVGILTNDRFVFGAQLAQIFPKPFVERRPKNKPFFHPSAMHAKLARSMVNLARSKTGELVLDPFCGTGGMLIEAALIGCRVLGLDVQRRMARGSMRNLTYFKTEPEGVLVADARNPPVTRVDRVVTDPPYGTSATTLKRPTRQVIEEVLTAVHDLLAKGNRVCLAAPRTLNVKRLGMGLGYKHLESHFVYVHRSLTREVAVFEKV